MPVQTRIERSMRRGPGTAAACVSTVSMPRGATQAGYPVHRTVYNTTRVLFIVCIVELFWKKIGLRDSDRETPYFLANSTRMIGSMRRITPILGPKTSTRARRPARVLSRFGGLGHARTGAEQPWAVSSLRRGGPRPLPYCYVFLSFLRLTV